MSKKEETKDHLAIASITLIQNLLDLEDKRSERIEQVGDLIGRIRNALVSGVSDNVPKLSEVLIKAIIRTGRCYPTNRHLTEAGNRLKWQLNRRKPRARRTLQVLLRYEMALDYACHGDIIETEKTFQTVLRGVLQRVSILDTNVLAKDTKLFKKISKVLRDSGTSLEALIA